MSNSYYNHSTYPAPSSPGSSAQLRSEFELITSGFSKLPTISLANANKVVAVNASGDSLVSTSALQGLAITVSSINATPIGASSPSTGGFTNLTVSGISLLGNSVTIGGGAINATAIGGTTPAAGYFTTLSSTGGISGNVTGNLTGNVTGSVTGNVTAASGTSSFNNVTINGQLDMNGGTTATITNLSSPVNSADAATKSYVDTSIANLISSSPSTLDTLNELAAALGNDPNFATTMTNSLAGKLSLTGGTMSGQIAMGSNKITGLADPSSNQDAVTKYYADTALLKITGGTMSGAIAMGNNKITGLATPTTGQDAVNKSYIDTLYGSTASAATSASNAAASEANALTYKNAAYSSQLAAAASENNAAASYDAFDDRYLGAKAADPSLDNDGNTLLVGALYWNTASNNMKVWTGSAWSFTYLPASGYLTTADAATTYQPLDGDLTSIAGLSGTTGLLKKTAANTWTLDTTTYLDTTTAAATYLTSATAASTYQTQAGMSSYLTSATAASTYQTQSGMSSYLTSATAASTYQTQAEMSSYLTTSSASTTYAALAGATFTGAVILSDQNFSRAMLKDQGFAYYNSGTTNALDYTNGSHQRWAPATGAQTLSITNWPPTGNLGELLIEGVNLGAATITWPTINWVKSDGTTTTTFASNGVTLQSSGTDWVYLWTRDAGTTIYGKVVR